jgi:hypothetical protein
VAIRHLAVFILRILADPTQSRGVRDSKGALHLCTLEVIRAVGLAENVQIADQRLVPVRLTRGNVGGSRRPGNDAAETRLAGWGGRIELSDQEKPPLEHGLTATEGRSARHIHCRLDWGAMAAQQGKSLIAKRSENEGKFGPHFKGQFWKRHL